MCFLFFHGFCVSESNALVELPMAVKASIHIPALVLDCFGPMVVKVKLQAGSDHKDEMLVLQPLRQ